MASIQQLIEWLKGEGIGTLERMAWEGEERGFTFLRPSDIPSEFHGLVWDSPIETLQAIEGLLAEVLGGDKRPDVYLSGWSDLSDALIPQRLSVGHSTNKLIPVAAVVKSMRRNQRAITIERTYVCLKDGTTLRVRIDPELNYVPPPIVYLEDGAAVACNPKNWKEWKVQNAILKEIAYVELVDMPDRLPPGSTPQSIRGVLVGGAVLEVRPGQRLIAYVVPRAIADPGKTTWYVRYRIVGWDVVGEDQEEATSDEEKIVERLKEWARKDPDGWRNAVLSSFAPRILGLGFLKEAVLLSAIGGVEREEAGGKTRGRIHTLAVTEPGIGKSDIASYVRKVHPRCDIVTGVGSTAAGITATVVRTKEGDWELRLGAIVKVIDGLLVFDEFDKADNEVLQHLSTAMEEGYIVVAKADIQAELPAPISVVAFANPPKGRYDPFKTLRENLKNIPWNILSRFDLIFVLRYKGLVPFGTPPEEWARLLTHFMYNRSDVKPILSPSEMRAFIKYARTLKPKWTEEALEVAEHYISQLMAIAFSEEDLDVPITGRNAIALKRLAEAEAKLELSTTVEPRHVYFAIALYHQAVSTYGIDPITGEIDVVSAASREYGGHKILDSIVEELADMLVGRAEMSDKGLAVVTFEELIDLFKEVGGERAKEILRKMWGGRDAPRAKDVKKFIEEVVPKLEEKVEERGASLVARSDRVVVYV
jgi:DNA replicative helicase MCM subunit Mcm2 (Cdc46/Mcm family)